MMRTMLGVSNQDVIVQTSAQCSGYVAIPWLKKLYERYLGRGNELEGLTNYEEEEERDLTREY